MPTYTFRCEHDHETDSSQPCGTELIPCPTCGGSARRRFTLPTPSQFMNRVGFQYTRSQFVKARDKGTWAGWKARE